MSQRAFCTASVCAHCVLCPQTLFAFKGLRPGRYLSKDGIGAVSCCVPFSSFLNSQTRSGHVKKKGVLKSQRTPHENAVLPDLRYAGKDRTRLLLSRDAAPTRHLKAFLSHFPKFPKPNPRAVAPLSEGDLRRHRRSLRQRRAARANQPQCWSLSRSLSLSQRDALSHSKEEWDVFLNQRLRLSSFFLENRSTERAIREIRDSRNQRSSLFDDGSRCARQSCAFENVKKKEAFFQSAGTVRLRTCDQARARDRIQHSWPRVLLCLSLSMGWSGLKFAKEQDFFPSSWKKIKSRVLQRARVHVK